MDPDYIDVNYNACLEIEAAMESLINLSEIIESIAMEAATEGEESEGIDKKKKNLAIKKMADEWLGKFKEWGKKFDTKVTVDKSLDEGEITNNIVTITDKFIKAMNDGWDRFDNIDKEIIKDIEKTVDKLGVEISKVKRTVDESGGITKMGLFKALRNRIASLIKNHSTMIEKDGYADAIRTEIKTANKIMTHLNRINCIGEGHEKYAKAGINELNENDKVREERKKALIDKTKELRAVKTKSDQPTTNAVATEPVKK